MTILLDLVDYRVETHASIRPTESAERPEAVLRIVRAHDGAFIELDRTIENVFALLWERAHGIPEAETAKWTKGWIPWLEEEATACLAAGGTYWEGPDA